MKGVLAGVSEAPRTCRVVSGAAVTRLRAGTGAAPFGPFGSTTAGLDGTAFAGEYTQRGDVPRSAPESGLRGRRTPPRPRRLA